MERTRKILIVEDNPSNVVLFKDLLEARGYQVVIANSGFEAFDILESMIPNLILMDIQLPGMDGFSAIKAIRSTPTFAQIKIIGISAFAMESDVVAAMEAGCNGYITKPISIRTFIEEVERHLVDTERSIS